MGMATGGKGVTADINVTPLIDVVLVLLIIFMVITPMLQKGFSVNLPEGADPEAKSDDQDDVILSLACNNQASCTEAVYYYHEGNRVQEEVVPEERIKQLLKELQERAPGSPLFIKADKNLRYGDVRKAMIMCESAGFNDVALVATKRTTSDG